MAENQTPPLYDAADLFLFMPYHCSEVQKDALTKSFSRQDIKDAFFALARNETSGSDDYYAEFFTGAWSIVGSEATDAILEFFKSGSMLK